LIGTLRIAEVSVLEHPLKLLKVLWHVLHRALESIDSREEVSQRLLSESAVLKGDVALNEALQELIPKRQGVTEGLMAILQR